MPFLRRKWLLLLMGYLPWNQLSHFELQLFLGRHIGCTDITWLVFDLRPSFKCYNWFERTMVMLVEKQVVLNAIISFLVFSFHEFFLLFVRSALRLWDFYTVYEVKIVASIPTLVTLQHGCHLYVSCTTYPPRCIVPLILGIRT